MLSVLVQFLIAFTRYWQFLETGTGNALSLVWNTSFTVLRLLSSMFSLSLSKLTGFILFLDLYDSFPFSWAIHAGNPLLLSAWVAFVLIAVSTGQVALYYP